MLTDVTLRKTSTSEKVENPSRREGWRGFHQNFDGRLVGFAGTAIPRITRDETGPRPVPPRPAGSGDSTPGSRRAGPDDGVSGGKNRDFVCYESPGWGGMRQYLVPDCEKANIWNETWGRSAGLSRPADGRRV